jgi:hypothetical protein
MLRISALRATPLLALGLTVPALAQTRYVTTITYVNTPGHPTNVVPGTGGLAFNAGGGSASAFERPTFSGNGLHFGINVLAETGAVTTNDDVLLVDGALVIREGSPAPWLVSENVGTIDAEFGLNDAGDLLIGNNTSAAANDDVVAVFQASVWTELAREGSLISTFVPGLVGDAGNTGTWDDATDTVRLSNVGPLWRGEGVDLLATVPTTLNDELFVLGAGTALQKGVSIPLGQAGGGTDAWENFALESAFVSPDGSVVIIEGDLLGATTGDEVVVVNGTVVVQEGVVLAGSTFANGVDSAGIVKIWVDHANNWYVRGNNDLTEDDWVYRNGVVVAQSDGTNEIVPFSGEHWTDVPAAGFADCFFAMDGNALGHYVIGGVTDAPAATNGVIVFYDGTGDSFVVARENDPVDLNGNGLFDDDRFFNTFGNDDVLLMDDGRIIFTATLENSLGTAVDQGLFLLTPRSGTCTFRNGNGVNPVALTCTTLPVVGTNFVVDVSFGANTVASAAYLAFAPIAPFLLTFPIGELLIDPTAYAFPGAGLPVNYSYLGIQVSLQGLRLENNGDLLLTNAQDVVFGY